MYVCMYVCMYAGEHQWLLGEEVDLLPALLLPLAGPEQFSEEETERLPLDLQYLPDDKRRESDPDIRKMLIETIMQVGTACGCSDCGDIILLISHRDSLRFLCILACFLHIPEISHINQSKPIGSQAFT